LGNLPRLLLLTIFVSSLPTSAVAQPRGTVRTLTIPEVERLAQRVVEGHRGDQGWGLSGALLGRSASVPRVSRPVSAEGPAPLRRDASEAPHRFRGALIGSTVGVGVSVGTLLILSDDNFFERSDRETYDDRGAQAGGVALLAIVGSAPLGAGLGESEAIGQILVASVLGELIVGGMGALAGAGTPALFGGDASAQNTGAAIGAAAGAAVGSALGATLEARQSDAALSVRDGEWTLRVPRVQVRPSLRPGRFATVHVPLLTADL
jgi:hypothetical protein